MQLLTYLFAGQRANLDRTAILRPILTWPKNAELGHYHRHFSIKLVALQCGNIIVSASLSRIYAFFFLDLMNTVWCYSLHTEMPNKPCWTGNIECFWVRFVRTYTAGNAPQEHSSSGSFIPPATVTYLGAGQHFSTPCDFQLAVQTIHSNVFQTAGTRPVGQCGSVLHPMQRNCSQLIMYASAISKVPAHGSTTTWSALIIDFMISCIQVTLFCL